MRSGKLNSKISIQKPVLSQNDFGEELPDWLEVAVLGAEIKPLSGTERYKAMQISSEESVQISFRFVEKLKDFDSTYRIYDLREGKMYDVKAVLNIDNRNRQIIVMAKKHG